MILQISTQSWNFDLNKWSRLADLLRNAEKAAGL